MWESSHINHKPQPLSLDTGKLQHRLLSVTDAFSGLGLMERKLRLFRMWQLVIVESKTGALIAESLWFLW